MRHGRHGLAEATAGFPFADEARLKPLDVVDTLKDILLDFGIVA